MSVQRGENWWWGGGATEIHTNKRRTQRKLDWLRYEGTGIQRDVDIKEQAGELDRETRIERGCKWAFIHRNELSLLYGS